MVVCCSLTVALLKKNQFKRNSVVFITFAIGENSFITKQMSDSVEVNKPVTLCN